MQQPAAAVYGCGLTVGLRGMLLTVSPLTRRQVQMQQAAALVTAWSEAPCTPCVMLMILLSVIQKTCRTVVIPLGGLLLQDQRQPAVALRPLVHQRALTAEVSQNRLSGQRTVLATFFNQANWLCCGQASKAPLVF